MKLKEIISLIENYFPLDYAYEWDNSGLQIGDINQEINKILISLDLTEENLQYAVNNKIDCIITHHPLIFSGIKNITADTKTGRMILTAIENKISVYSAHTNMDVAPEGINTFLCRIFNMKNTEIIEPHPCYENTGLGKIGDIAPISLSCLMEEIKDKLNTPAIRYSGDENQIIKKVAVGSGSCSELIPQAIKLGADTIITADLKYHTCLDYASNNFSIIDAGHFPTENIIKEIFFNILSKTDIEIIKYNQTDVFRFI